MMTVRELIELLSQYDENLPVYVGGDGPAVPCEEVHTFDYYTNDDALLLN